MFTSVTHMSPSRTASLAIIVRTRSPFVEISKSQKSGHVFVRGLSIDLTSLRLRLCIGVKLRAASGPYRLRIHTTWAPPLLLCFVLCALSFVAFDESFLFMQIVEPLGNSVSKRTLRSGAWESLSLHDLCPCLCHCQAAAKGCVMGERGF